MFFGYNPAGCSDDEDDAPSPPCVPGCAATAEAEGETPWSGSRASTAPENEPEPAELKTKRRKVRGTTKTRSRGKLFSVVGCCCRLTYNITHRTLYSLKHL